MTGINAYESSFIMKSLKHCDLKKKSNLCKNNIFYEFLCSSISKTNKQEITLNSYIGHITNTISHRLICHLLKLSAICTSIIIFFLL